MVESLMRGITPGTRALALTWVHSSTGLKLPMAEISRAVAGINRRRSESERILVCLDGVHGFGVEDFEVQELGCDFFMAGCHKWLFGPRGTGIVWGREGAWARLSPTIPSFMDGESWNAWALEREPKGTSDATRMSPGGFKPFEHQWAMVEAFRFHEAIGKPEVAKRTHELSRQLKEGLAKMAHVRLYTPMDDALSAGIVCFGVNGISARGVVERLAGNGIVATTTPYLESYPRFSPCVYNTPEDLDARCARCARSPSLRGCNAPQAAPDHRNSGNEPLSAPALASVPGAAVLAAP
jgi:selenocysteine lyase/cysteine desulfurase